MDSYEAKSKDSIAESSEKHTVGESKEVTSPPDFRNILKKFEGTRDIVKVEKIPSATDVLPPTVSPCKIGEVCESEAKNVNTSAEDLKAGTANVEEVKKVDNTQAISAIPANVIDDLVDSNNEDKAISSKDSAEKNVVKPTTGASSKSFSSLKDPCSHKTEVNTSDMKQMSPKAATMKPVLDTRESKAKVMLVGENVLHHPLSVIEDEETAEELVCEKTREELLIDLGINDEVESGVATSDLPNPPKKKLSLKELEQAFISALKTHKGSGSKIGVQNIAKLVSKSVPAIKITDASEFEMEKKPSEFVEDTADKTPTEILSEAEHSEVSADVNVQSTSETPIDDCSSEGQSSLFQSRSLEFYEKEDVVTEAPKKDEAKPFFYISSSEIPPELRHRVTAMSQEAYTSQEPNDRVSQSCLCSKDLHGMVFLIGFSIALLAFCVAALAHRGAIPAFYEVIGFSVSIVSGIFALLSFLCYTILTCYSACTAHGYQRLSDLESALPFNRGRQSENFVVESWSSETERAFRRQNGMSSTRTSLITVGSESERQALISKTERIKKDVTELLDTFANMMTEQEPAESIEMQALANEDEEKSDNLQESPPE